MVRSGSLIRDNDSELNDKAGIFDLTAEGQKLHAPEAIDDESVQLGDGERTATLPRSGYFIDGDAVRLFRILDTGDIFGDAIEKTLIIMTAAGIDLFSRDDTRLPGAVARTSKTFIDAVNKSTVRLAAESYRGLSPDGRRHLNTIQGYCRDIGEVNDRIMTLAGRCDRSGSLDKTDLNVLFDEACRLASGGRAVKANCHIDPLPTVTVVRDHMLAVLVSLAASMTPLFSSAEQPAVRVGSKVADGRCCIHFTLNGFNKARADVETLFSPYFVLSEGDGETTVWHPGLELVLVRRVLKAFGGRLRIDGDNRKAAGVEISWPCPEKE